MMQQRASVNHQLRISGAPEAWSHVRISNEKANFIHFQVHWSLCSKWNMIRHDRSSTAYLPITFSNKTVKGIIKFLCLGMRHGSLICGKAGAFAPIRSKFRCTGTSTSGQQILWLCHKYPDTCTEYLLAYFQARWDRQICSDRSVIMICAQDSRVHQRIQGLSSWVIKHCLFANFICQFKQTRRYWVPVSGYKWNSHSICWPMVEVRVHWRILAISLWQIQHRILTNPMWQSKQTRQYWVLVSKYET